MKDKRALVFYFLMTLIFLDFGNHLKRISYNSFFENFNNPIFSIIHLNNSGSAFSLFQNQAKILAIFGIVAILIILFHVFKNITFNDKHALLSLTLFSAGTIGNALERLQLGYVVDYIKLNFIDFPVFNSYDIMICLGIVLYIIFVLFENKKAENEQNSNQ